MGVPIREERPPARTMPALRGMGTMLSRCPRARREPAARDRPRPRRARRPHGRGGPRGRGRGAAAGGRRDGRGDLPSGRLGDGRLRRAGVGRSRRPVGRRRERGRRAAARLHRARREQPASRPAPACRRGRTPSCAGRTRPRTTAASRVPAAAVGAHVRSRAEVIARGDVLLPAGAWIGAHEVVALGSAGHASVSCRRRPRVALLATGAELIALGAPPASAVWDSAGSAWPPRPPPPRRAPGGGADGRRRRPRHPGGPRGPPGGRRPASW